MCVCARVCTAVKRERSQEISGVFYEFYRVGERSVGTDVSISIFAFGRMSNMPNRSARVHILQCAQ